MSVSPEYRAFVVEQLGRLVPLRVRSMFGGLGLYADDLFFGLVSGDALYFKVDEHTRAGYEAAGSAPFAPGDAARPMQYYQVPHEVLEDRDELRGWVEQAVEVARRAPRKKRR